ncbi:MAG: TRAP transporter large permease [Betaproteobacteria bacterium]
MSSEAIGAIGLVVMLGLLALRMPIGIAMFLVGSVGFAVLNGPQAALMALGTYPYSYAAYYDLAVIPLFVLMGSIASACGMGQSLFAAAYAWVGHWRGGLASATILSCAGFAAVSGSSVASAVTMGRVCLPEMRRYRYDSGLAAGTVAAGGTLGILIPPSTAFVIYGILTEQSIGKLLLAGVLPGLLLTLLFVITIMIWTGLQPNLGPAGERSSFAQRWRALGQSAPMLGLVFASIGGIYAGVFTPAEAAAVGAFLALAWAWITGHLSRAVLEKVLLDTVRTTAMVFLILMGALVFGPFLALSGLPTQVADLLTGTSLSSFAVLLMIMALYLVLGMFLEGFSILVLTLPIVIPIVKALGYDLIWFGVILVILLEMGLISPPVGMNVFVVKGLVPDTSMGAIFRSIMPFWVAMVVCVALIVAFPGIALMIPEAMIR